jgi:hypothetical protein
MVHVYYDLPVRLHACSPPRLAAMQLVPHAGLNRLIAPAGLSPALTPASRAHQDFSHDPMPRSPSGGGAMDSGPSPVPRRDR